MTSVISPGAPNLYDSTYSIHSLTARQLAHASTLDRRRTPTRMAVNSSGVDIEPSHRQQRASRRRRDDQDEIPQPEGPAPKRSRTTATKSHDLGASNGTSSKLKRTKKYEEEDGGFQFTRGKGKRAKKTESAPAATDHQVEEAVPPRGEPAKKVSSAPVQREEEPIDIPKRTTRASRQTEPQSVRRSARLIERNDDTVIEPDVRSKPQTSRSRPDRSAPIPEEPIPSQPKSKPRSRPRAEQATSPPPPTIPQPERRQKHKVPSRVDPPDKPDRADPPDRQVRKEGSHRVSDTPPSLVSHKPTTIALPFSDTPIIRRNKEMRKHGGGHRRSSVGLRGRRASSLIDSGMSTAIPHADVASRDFFKHIDQQMLEPKRMKCLLTWCAARAGPEKQAPSATDPNELLVQEAVRQIAADLVKDLSTAEELSNWFVREDDLPVQVITKPNPRNAAMMDRARQLEAEIAALKAERASWERMLNPPVAVGTPDRPDGADDPETIDTTLLDPDQASIVASLFSSTAESAHRGSDPSSPPPQPSSILSRLRPLLSSLEPVVDAFADGIHRIDQFRLTGGRMVDHLLNVSAEYLDVRDREERDREVVLAPKHSSGDDDASGDRRSITAEGLRSKSTGSDTEKVPQFEIKLGRVPDERRIPDMGVVLGALAGVLSEKDAEE